MTLLSSKKKLKIVSTRQSEYRDPEILTMDPAIQVVLDQLQTEVQISQAAAAAAADTAAVPPLGPPAPPSFTLAPALANTATTYLDLTSSAGAKHFKGATEPLSKGVGFYF